MPKKIAVVTGARWNTVCSSDLKQIHADPALTLQLIVTGMHLSPEFGLTYQQILDDGFMIDAKVEMLLSSDSPVGITKSVGLGVIGFADAYARLQPDIIVLLGDRFEILAAAQAALIAKIPVAHIHGGELSFGAIDDAMRHSISKMSHLHFVACEDYRRRVIQLGENPERVFNTGAMVLDAMVDLPLLSKAQLSQALSVTFKQNNFLITYHPETLGRLSSKDAFAELLEALSPLADCTLIFTEANADADGRIINEMIKAFCKAHQDAYSFQALGQLRYLSLLKQVDVMIGNSSSGIIEAPYFKIPTVNIGHRQAGRIMPKSVIHCQPAAQEIKQAIQHAMSQQHHQAMETMALPYGQGSVSPKIIDVLKRTDLAALNPKQFYDIPTAE
uniref:GDP/UDP-N,N'-diacetylbacillosamine 2-epimerase (Hydrolyzing) n=1 Tax=Candidatus Berkiella aquae TaxID=295108 RepID=A0A0Q9YZP1_9GAMM